MAGSPCFTAPALTELAALNAQRGAATPARRSSANRPRARETRVSGAKGGRLRNMVPVVSAANSSSADADTNADAPMSAKERADAANRALMEWLGENGMHISDSAGWGVPPHSLVISNETTDDFEPSGRGLLARREITQSEALFQIPKALVITKSTAQQLLGKHVITDETDEFIALALALLTESTKGARSFYKPYLDIIPSMEELNPLFLWSEEDRQVLRGSPTLIAAESLKQKLVREYEMVMQDIVLKHADVFPARNGEAFMSQQDWNWAFAVLFSRTICFPSTKELALVPYADLMNHSSFCACFFDCRKGGSMFDRQEFVVLYSDRDYKQAEQVYVTYGQKSNAELLLLYGFVVERNPFDSVELCVSLSEQDPLYDRKRNTLDDWGLPTVSRFPLFQDRYPKELIEYLRFCCATEKEMDADFGEFVSRQNEDSVAAALIEACEAALEGYPNSIEEDEALLGDRSLYSMLTQNMKWAIKLRRAEKRILKRTITNTQRERKRPSLMFSATAGRA
ncbi:Ribulose-1,5 bisphosphate carboxylase/oxygenase large subunit N-methyltransferase, chloroplastic [Porphyridium purpureum]|uniref:Ribulose-1,5 bisphosphate carboxylase/oxygenase large subunit N-methyltransferase, chloroplastic n=1 Tax=Porphyridium purpureum TaxID=35688 RepID=A0A5J4ZBP4_PORPP|nr:Ribulose-1,5 bisphosphate carboxylase/oxygenase large subunit N-methyltransferase, chloroplastic [Porphyridium purpureum]|eukprot:POR8343..scf295_1